MYQRLLSLPQLPETTFFLWGPRQVGKSSLLKIRYPDAPVIDLLKTDEFSLYNTEPHKLRERALAAGWSFIIIDEIQKAPKLLDEVHFLIENHGMVFGLCGSSARKVKRGHANLLGGRALRFEMSGLVSRELAGGFDLEHLLASSYMPLIFDSKNPMQHLKSYCNDYLKEEIYSEGLVKDLQPFGRFLEIAALGDTESLSFETVARDCGVSAPTVKSYYEILVDTLLARYLPSYTRRPKRRQVKAPKFYFKDVGVVNFLSQRGAVRPKSMEWGKAFENWVHHEITTYLEYSQRIETLSYWRLTTGVEVDFIVGHMRCAIEAKGSYKITADHLKGLRELVKDFPETESRVIVSMEPHSRQLDDGILILSVEDFTNRLWQNTLF